jgi:hypothetical protein
MKVNLQCAVLLGLWLMASLSLFAAPTLYWGLNGNGTWNATSLNWASNLNGAATRTWTSGDNAYFSSNSVTAPAITITVSGTENVTNLRVAKGGLTFTGGILNFSAGAAITINTGASATFNSTISGTPTLTLAGGTLNLAVGSLSLKSLTVTANSVLDFNSGGNAVLNLSSLTVNSGVTLTIKNWANAADYFYVNNNPSTVTLNSIDFSSYPNGATWQSYDHQILPVPEPATYGAVLILLGLSWFGLRCRLI